MKTLATLSTQVYTYKGLEVKMVDTIKQSQYGNNSAYPTRTWYVNGIEAHTYKVDGETKLAFYDIPASEGGSRKILAGFAPEGSFYIEQSLEMRRLVYELTGKPVHAQI